VGNNLPIACSLSAVELTERKKLLEQLKPAVVQREQLEDGFVYVFKDDSVMDQLAQIIQAERQCCPFLNFKIELHAGAEPLRLEVSGPVGSKPFIPDLFGEF
jgi:hypothetical protein